MRKIEAIRPGILAALDAAISIGVLTTSGLVSFQVALLATLGGTLSMAVGEWVSTENSQLGLSPIIAALGSIGGFLAGSLLPLTLVLSSSPLLVLLGSAGTLLILAALVSRLNGLRYGVRAATLGLAALAISYLIGV